MCGPIDSTAPGVSKDDLPAVRQEQLAEWAGVPHPVISRWFGYWLDQDWRRLLSQRWGEVLTLEVQQRIIDSWVLHPWWTAQQAWQHLRSQGSAITLNQVKQAGRESGWTTLRQTMTGVYRIEPESFRPRDEWLTRQLLAQVQELVTQLEAQGGLPPEQQVRLADWGRWARNWTCARPSPAVLCPGFCRWSTFTGWSFGVQDMLLTGERIANIRQAFNAREGINALARSIPPRAYGRPPLRDGPTAGIEVQVEQMVAEYLDDMEWMQDAAVPLPSVLARLGLDSIARDLWGT
jgi:hypothetical protein